MTRIGPAKQREVRVLTTDTLMQLLTFHVSHSSLHFIHDQSTSNWRELEDRLHDHYPIKGVGVKATRANLGIIGSQDGGFLWKEEDLFPGDVPSELASYPYCAASAAYVFSVVEGFGNQLVELVNPRYLKERQVWHHAVYSDADLRDPEIRKKMRVGFGKPFKRAASSVPVFVVRRLVKLKKLRNAFMHEGDAGIDFDEFFSLSIATVIFLYFLLAPNLGALSVYPYHDYHDRWRG